jgi:hypothetical protein
MMSVYGSSPALTRVSSPWKGHESSICANKKEVEDEIDLARREGYALASIQWFEHSSKRPRSPSGLATNADDFFRQINEKALPMGIYTGKTFFLYSGDRDEQWGQEMSRKMGNARGLVEFYGGTVAEWAKEADGKHMGYRLIPGIHERAMRGFLRPQ